MTPIIMTYLYELWDSPPLWLVDATAEFDDNLIFAVISVLKKDKDKIENIRLP